MLNSIQEEVSDESTEPIPARRYRERRDGTEEAVDVVSSAAEIHPQADEVTQVPLQPLNGALVSAGEDATVSVPRAFSDPIEVSPAGTWGGELTGLTIGLPEQVQSAEVSVAQDGSAVGEGSEVTGVIQALEGGLRISTVITGPDAPGRLSYALPDDVDIAINEDGSASLSRTAVDDGTEVLTATIGRIGTPWATDARGQRIATHYEVSGSKLVQVVDHHQDGVAYPVVADPTFWWGWNVYLSNSVVGQVVKVILAGAGAAVLASRLIALVPGIGTVAVNVTSLAGALLGFGAALLNVCNIKSRGVWVGHTWVTGVLPFAPTVMRSGYFCVPN